MANAVLHSNDTSTARQAGRTNSLIWAATSSRRSAISLYFDLAEYPGCDTRSAIPISCECIEGETILLEPRRTFWASPLINASISFSVGNVIHSLLKNHTYFSVFRAVGSGHDVSFTDQRATAIPGYRWIWWSTTETYCSLESSVKMK